MQITATELETAILDHIAKGHPSLSPIIEQLNVLSRKFTGAGSYTDFAHSQAASDLSDGYLGLDALIEIPGVPNGLGATLICEAGYPTCLEIYTYGGESWDGDSNGFTIT